MKFTVFFEGVISVPKQEPLRAFLEKMQYTYLFDSWVPTRMGKSCRQGQFSFSLEKTRLSTRPSINQALYDAIECGILTFQVSTPA